MSVQKYDPTTRPSSGKPVLPDNFDPTTSSKGAMSTDSPPLAKGTAKGMPAGVQDNEPTVTPGGTTVKMSPKSANLAGMQDKWPAGLFRYTFTPNAK